MTIPIPEKATVQKKTGTVCFKCKSPLDSRARRGWFVKTFLFWLPIRKFKCYKCKRTQYAFINR